MNNNIPKHQEHYEKYSDEDYDKFYLDADDICFCCGHQRGEHDYSPTDKISNDSSCEKCNCTSFILDYNSEFVLPWKRLFWKLFKGYKTPRILLISRKLKPFTKEEIEQIKKEFP